MIFSKPCRFVLFSAYLLMAIANADTVRGLQQRELEATAKVELGTAGNYAILGSAGITNVAPSVITGAIAVSPIVGTSMTGWGLTPVDGGRAMVSSQISKFAYAASYAVPTPDILATAVADMLTAYKDAEGRNSIATQTTAVVEMGGRTLTAVESGVYSFTAGVTITSDVIIEGNSEDVFIIQIAGNLAIAGGVKVILTGGVRPENIFWQISGYVSALGDAHLEGILLVATAVTFITGTSLNGRILCRTACVLQKVIINEPTLSVIEPPPPVNDSPTTPFTEPTELEARWALENPTTQYVAADNKFTMTYNEASSKNVNANLRAAFFDGNCQNPVALDDQGNTVAAFRLLVNMGITAVGNTAMPVPFMDSDISKPVLEFEVDTLKLANTDEIYEVVDQALIDNEDKPYGDDDMGKGVMTMCARFSLGYSTGDAPTDYQEVNFIESVITIKYDLTAGFSVDAFAVEAKDKDAATGVKDSYQVIAYLCNASTLSTGPVPDGAGGLLLGVPAKITAFAPLNGLPNSEGSAFAQGSLVTVCVTPDALTIADGIVMGAITDFTWKRGDTEQVAVETNTETGAFEAASNSLTALSCNPQDVFCSFASILFADFYLSAGTVAGEGNANMEFRNTRRLKGGVEGERRQLQEAAAASPFDVSVGVTELDDGPGALKTAGGASMGFTALASAVAFVSAALLA